MIAATLLSLLSTSTVALEFHAAPPPPMPTLSAAATLGITLESVIVSGIADGQPAEVQGMLARIDNAVSLRQSLAASLSSAEAAAADHRHVRQMLLLEPESAYLLVQLESVAAEVAMHQQAIVETRQLLLELALDPIPAANAAVIHAWTESGQHAVPASFRAVSRSPEQWKAIVRGLRAEARSLRTGAPLDELHSSLLVDTRTQPEVVEADYKLAQMSGQVAQVFLLYAQD